MPHEKLASGLEAGDFDVSLFRQGQGLSPLLYHYQKLNHESTKLMKDTKEYQLSWFSFISQFRG